MMKARLTGVGQRPSRWLGYLLLGAVFFAGVMPSDAIARRRSRRSKAGATHRKGKAQSAAASQTSAAIEKLMGKYRWGQTKRQVLALLEREIRAERAPELKAEKDPIKQDQLRKELSEELDRLRKNVVSFGAKATAWDVSLVDKEFAHNNNESMVVRWGRKDRRFYFFHNDRLWKIYIAFNSDLYRGKTFEDFAGVMERRFGPAERKFRETMAGEAVLSHLEWPPAGKTVIRVIDNTQFYGNFCLVLLDRNELDRVSRGRKLLRPTRRGRDPLIQSVLKPGGSRGDVNADVVDQITGRRVKAPTYSDTEAQPDQPEGGATSPSSGGGAAAPGAPAQDSKGRAPRRKSGGGRHHTGLDSVDL